MIFNFPCAAWITIEDFAKVMYYYYRHYDGGTRGQCIDYVCGKLHERIDEYDWATDFKYSWMSGL